MATIVSSINNNGSCLEVQLLSEGIKRKEVGGRESQDSSVPLGLIGLSPVEKKSVRVSRAESRGY